ncbi:MAG: glucose-6-phosphate dehydrogenase [Pseudomonadota bacterium]
MIIRADTPSGIRIREIPGVPILKERTLEPCVLVIFGVTGDLAARKLVPALYNLKLDRALPESMFVLGVGRKPHEISDLRKKFLSSANQFSRRTPIDPKVWESLAADFEYIAGEFERSDLYQALKTKLAATDVSHGTRGNRMFYLAVPPELFPVILNNLVRAGLVGGPREESWTRVIIEKPFGRDFASACELNRLVAGAFDESQVFRIDHYLGKETVQNILVFRFGNPIFEHLWNRKYIDHVQITAAESMGVGHRGAFYDETGVVRDVVQNHLLQVLALCAMEPPSTLSADDIRDEKARVFRALRPIAGDEAAEQVIMGQYHGYLSEDGVAKNSRTPTYVAMKILIDNWRWQGIPFYLRAGKGLSQRVTEVAIQFQPVPLSLFGQEETCQIVESNVLALRIQPNEGVSLRFVAKVPGEHVSVGNVFMNMNYAEAFGKPISEAYERLLLDCIRGDATLFARRDGVEEAWKFITPIVEAWEGNGRLPVRLYEQGTPGPKEADDLLIRDGRRWRAL